MAVYDLEEQDQLEDLKAWWKQWGNTIAGVVIAVCVGVIGVQGWRWWSQQQAEQASVLYNAVSAAARANDVAKAKDAMAQLADKYGGTGYAPRGGADRRGACCSTPATRPARRRSSPSVIDRDTEDELKQIARLRLAAMLFDDKQYDDALRTLDAKHDDAFAGIYADMRGDILAAAGRNAEARTAYQTALARLDAKSPYRNFVQVKLDTLGGAVAAAGAAPAPAPARRAAAAPAAGAGAAPPQVAPHALPPVRRSPPRPPTDAARRLPPPDTSTIARTRRPLRAPRSLALLALAGCSTLSSWIPTIPPPSFDWFSSSKKLGPLPEFKATVDAADRAGRSPSARPRRDSRRRSPRDAIYAAATNGTIVRVDPATRRDRMAHRGRQAPVGGRRRRFDARRRRHRQGRRARVHRRRQAAVAGEGHERGRQPAEGRRGHRRRLVGRRPRVRTVGRRRQDPVGVPAQQSAAHGAQLSPAA